MARVPRLVFAASLGALACNALLGADDPVPDFVDRDAGVSALPDCGPPPAADDGPIYVVATGGADVSTCGSHASPCATIGFALGQAKRASKTIVRVGPGTYREAITLVPGVTIEGGYFAEKSGDGYTWIPNCLPKPKPSDDVQIAPDVATPVIAADLGGTAALSTLTIHQSASPAPGESVYGIVATGASTHLELVDVMVAPANGADGTAGAPGDPGAAATDGGCPMGSGADGNEAGAPGEGADGGTIDGTGYHGAAGANGGIGLGGANGDAGAAGTCVTCSACNATCNTGPTQCGRAGSPGCGGGGGKGGYGGGGGGSSIALLAWGGATVKATGGSLRAGAGGAGGAGGTGGSGAPGTTGPSGSASDGCNVTCVVALGCSNFQTGKGGAGSPGGAGAAGGTGGGGAGGWSFAIVSGGDAHVEVPEETLDHSNFGRGGSPGGADGRSGKRYP